MSKHCKDCKWFDQFRDKWGKCRKEIIEVCSNDFFRPSKKALVFCRGFEPTAVFLSFHESFGCIGWEKK